MPDNKPYYIQVPVNVKLKASINNESDDSFTSDNTLWLPAGSIRAIIALAMTATSIVCIFVFGTIPESVATINSMAIGFYFGAKAK